MSSIKATKKTKITISIDRGELIAYPVTVVISGVIGILVAVIFYFTVNFPEINSDNRESLTYYLLWSGLAGCSIGFCAKLLFGIVFTRINSKPYLSFISVFVVIGCGTFLWSLVIGPELGGLTIIIIAVSEGIGMIATGLFWLASLRINKKLKDKQSRISNSQSE